MRTRWKTVLAVGLVGLMAFSAMAIEGRFRGRGKWRARMRIRERAQLDKRSRTVGTVSATAKLATAEIDGTGSTIFFFDSDVGDEGAIELSGALNRVNDHKGVVIPDSSDIVAVQQAWDAYVAAQSSRKKAKLSAVPIEFTSVTPKGLLKVNGNFSKAKFKVVYAVEGFIGSGDYAGHPVDGKIEFSVKGARSD